MVEQRTALITGANRGIGLAIAQPMSEKFGYRVIIGNRDLTKGKEAASRIGGDVSAVALDLSNRQQLAYLSLFRQPNV